MTPAKAAMTAVVALAVCGLVLLLLARGGEANDEQAVRNWFRTPAGGSAPPEVVSSIHVGSCLFTDATTESRQVLRCPITTDAPTPMLGTCFVISGGKVLQGGWQLARLDACNGLRFDRRTGELVDTAAHARYRVR
jgi:hypothetical protein